MTAGQLVHLVFVNSDVMPHNVLLGTPGSLEVIGAAADAMLADGARAAAQQYVPESRRCSCSRASSSPARA